MASTYPLAVIIVFSLVCVVILPLLWLVLAMWQRRCGLLVSSRVSIVLSMMPIISILGLYYGKEISAKYSVIFFAVSPFISVLALGTLFLITIFNVRSQNAL